MIRPRAVGILTNNPDEVFQRDVIQGAREVAGRARFETRVIAAPEGMHTASALAAEAGTLAGLLVIANVASDAALLAIHESGLPLSLVSHAIAGSGVPAVIPDNANGIRQLMHHVVVECGRGKLVFIQGHMGQNDGVTRAAALKAEMIRLNLPHDSAVSLRGDFEPAIAARSLAAHVRDGQSFDAVVAADYLMGIAALNVLRDAGVSVPGVVCVAGFGDGPESAAAGLTTVAADVVELGRRALRQLVGQIDGLAIRGTTILSTELIQRDTTAAPLNTSARP